MNYSTQASWVRVPVVNEVGQWGAGNQVGHAVPAWLKSVSLPAPTVTRKGTEGTHKWAFDGAVLLPNDLPPQVQRSNKCLPGVKKGGGGVCLEQRCSQALIWGSWKEDAETGGLALHCMVGEGFVCLQSVTCLLLGDGIVVQQETCLPAELCHSACSTDPVWMLPALALWWNWSGQSAKKSMVHNCSEKAFKYPHLGKHFVYWWKYFSFRTLGLSHIIQRLKWEWSRARDTISCMEEKIDFI